MSEGDQDQVLQLRISVPRPEKCMLSSSDIPPPQSKKTKFSVPETPVEDPQPAPPVPTTPPSKFKPSIWCLFNPPPLIIPRNQSSNEHSTTLDPQSLPQLEMNGSASSSKSIQLKPNANPELSSPERELAKLTLLLKDTAALLAIRTEEVQRLQQEVKFQALGNTLSQEYIMLQNLLPGPPSTQYSINQPYLFTNLPNPHVTKLLESATISHSNCITITHPRLPWAIKLRQASPLAVQDVLVGVWNSLQQPVSQVDYFNLDMTSAYRFQNGPPQTGQELVCKAFRQCCRAIGEWYRDQTGMIESTQISMGICRIDWLGMENQSIWIGVMQVGRKWELQTRSLPAS
ncbi:hypothetical protein EV368DRAFT_68874 [Lentinula lateritia]|nr:hypothetical protein EV368DRAFT_68874 [Lentinula lateritia]